MAWGGGFKDAGIPDIYRWGIRIEHHLFEKLFLEARIVKPIVYMVRQNRRTVVVPLYFALQYL
jgi:hypothetical protein